MKLLLDTHTWIWRLLAPERLSARAEEAVGHPDNGLFLSPISTWEALVLARKGRLALEPSPSAWVTEALRRSALTAAPITHEIALRSEKLPGFGSNDPADRFLAATALEHGYTVVTKDPAMQDYEALPTLW
ncbi:MAG: type II toxin-antitoxin system VapC family toxin [Thermoanaerobaculia bacterium]